MTILMCLGLFGGLGMFIYGMHLMSEGLKIVAGKRMRHFLDVLTSTPFKALLCGIIVTILTQSSSATTVMVVGFVNATLMNLYQAAGIILGTNIGTTLMSQIIAFDITEFSTFFIGIGVLMNLFMKKKKSRDWGGIVLGFGILFYGISVMSNSVAPLKDNPEFVDLLLSFGKNPFIGLLVSTLMTSILQSSGAVIGLIQSLALAGVFNSTSGTEAIQICIPLIIGSNIGTCITAILSSIGTSNTAKDAALIHLIDNVIGAVWVMLLLAAINLFFPQNPIYEFIIQISGNIRIDGNLVPNVARQIAMAHLLFNVANSAILFPFIKQIVNLVVKILPPENTEEDLQLDTRMLNTPDIALTHAERELVKLSKIVAKNFGRAMDSLIYLDEEKINKTFEVEKRIDEFEIGIQEFAIQIVGIGTPLFDNERAAFLLENSHTLERIGDHAENLAELAQEMRDKEETFSEGMLSTIKEMKTNIGRMLDQVSDLLANPESTVDIKFIYKEEDFIDRATCFQMKSLDTSCELITQ